MTDRMTDEEREMLIAGDRADALAPDEAADLSLLATLLADPSTWAEPRQGLEDDIVEAVVDDEPVGATVTDINEAPQRTRRRRRVMVPMAGAAAAVAIVFGAMLSSSGGAGPAFTATLSPTALVPGAHARAAVERNAGGFRIALDAEGLQPLPRGQYYEAWLKDTTGTLVPVGTFSSSDQRITLWSGASPDRFTTLTVTIESPDNNQASSGQVVLRGDIRRG